MTLEYKELKSYIPESLANDSSLRYLLEYIEQIGQCDPCKFFSIYSDLRWRLNSAEYWMSLDDFLENSKIQCAYMFLGNLFSELRLGDPCDTLDWPLINTMGKCYEDVLRDVFRKDQVSSYKKRVGKAFQKYGTRVLNNLLILREIIDISKNLDKILSLDHTKYIHSSFLKDENFRYIILLEKYFSIDRIFKLLVSEDVLEYTRKIQKCLEILKVLRESGVENIQLKNCRDWDSIADELLCNKDYARITNEPIDQSKIRHLHGKKICGYDLDVPDSSEKFCMAARVLKNCLLNYPSKIGVEHNRYVVFLWQENRICYAAEICKGDVVQIKGFRNKNIMTTFHGRIMRIEILNLIHNVNTKVYEHDI